MNALLPENTPSLLPLQRRQLRQSRHLKRLTLAVAAALGLLGITSSAEAQNFVVNGGFETGDFTGWIQSGNTADTGVDNGNPHSGNYAAYLGPVTTHGFLTQNIRAYAGGTYTLTYFLENGGGKGTFFSSTFNGQTLSSMTDSAAQPYTQYTFSGLQGNGSTAPLVFEFQQNPDYWYLDDVSLVLNNLRNSTFVSIGSTPGVLSMTGNYTQTSKGVLQIQVGGLAPGQHDLIVVGGSARLDGKLQLVRLNKFTMERGDKVTILTAADKVSGEFASVASDFGDTILSPVVAYKKHSVVLEVPTFTQFADSWELSANQHSVAAALDRVASDSRASNLINYLDRRNLTKLPGDFDKIAPDELTSVFTLGVSLAQVQSDNIQRRTDAIRSGANGFSAAGLAINGISPSYNGGFGIGSGVAGPSGDDGKDSKTVQNVVSAENRWGAFLSGTGEWVSVGNTDNARGYTLESGGFTLGVDYKCTPNFAVGLAAGYTGTTADLTEGGRVYVNGGNIGLYATFFQNAPEVPAHATCRDCSKDSKDCKEVEPPAASVAKGFYADVAVFGGYNSFDFHRSALDGTARGDTDGGELNVLFGTGYDFKKGNLTFGPTASFNYTYLGTSEFTEHDSLAPLNIHGAKADSLRTAFGLKASYDWKVGSVLVKPEIRAAWQHEYGDAAYDLTSSFANGAGDAFTVAGPQTGRDSALLGAGFAVQVNDRCATFVYYDGELGRKNYQSTAVTGGFRLSF